MSELPSPYEANTPEGTSLDNLDVGPVDTSSQGNSLSQAEFEPVAEQHEPQDQDGNYPGKFLG
jgi:hypothetical protein